jgi:TonB family protein
MNAAPAEPFLSGPVGPKVPAEGWSRQRWFFFIFLALAAHLAFLFLFGTKKQIRPRPVTNPFQLRLADSASELVALDDPTLFVLPHVNDFASAVWLKTPATALPDFRWPAPANWLPLAVGELGVPFQQFMQTNQFAAKPFKPDFTPEPLLTEPFSPLASLLPQRSTFQVGGELAHRRLLNQITVPSLAVNDVLLPSKVQVLVNTAGNVASVVVLESSGLNSADTTALALARKVRFAPAPQLAFGELIFNWHTVPVAATNPAAGPK